MLFQPLVIWCVCFCFGIVAGYYCHVPAVLLFVVLVAVSIAAFYFRNKRLCAYFIFGLAFLSGALDIIQAKALPSSSLANVANFSKETLLVRGIICSDPHVSQRKSTFMMAPQEVIADGVPSRGWGKVRVESYVKADYHYGDEIFAEGALHRLYRKAGIGDERSAAIFTIKKDNFFDKIGGGRRDHAVQLILALKHKIESFIFARLTNPFFDTLVAMLLGDGSKVPAELKQAMIKTGTWHLMVVSGSHTAFLAFAILLAFKVIRVRRTLRLCLTIFLLVVYCILTGASSPVVRATVMTAAYLLTYLLRRPPHFLNSLALAALAILIFDPTQLFQVGFQLSFLSVFFIFWIYPKLKNVFPAGVWKSRVSCGLANCFCVSFAAWLGTVPLLAYVFKTFSCISILANMVAAPLATLIMAGGFVLISLGSLWPSCAGPIASSVEFFISIFIRLHMYLNRIPWASISVRPVPLFLVIFCYAAIIFASKPQSKKP
ncbi:MAG: ComEC/Rec2 family competence protein [Candidatus Omnitrophica bacterium]|nr:ComEC/Rec2 family competence protein [Candidatus Omnitrophota bacterium]